MKLISIVLLTYVSLMHFIATAQNASPSKEHDVYNSIVLISDAWTKNDLETLEKYIHHDYVHTDVRGEKLDRSAWLSYVKGRKDKGVVKGDVKFEDVHINIYRDVAVVTGINTFSGQAYTSNDNAAGNVRKLRFTQILKNENDIWKRLVFQATYIDNAK
jgi:hypothetical protein